jgi:hypothetical protein
VRLGRQMRGPWGGARRCPSAQSMQLPWSIFYSHTGRARGPPTGGVTFGETMGKLSNLDFPDGVCATLPWLSQSLRRLARRYMLIVFLSQR